MLDSTNEPFRYLSHSDHFHVIVLDMEGRFKFLSNCYLKKFGHLPTSYIGGLSIESVIPEDRDLCTQASLKSIDNPGAPVHTVLRKSDGYGVFSGHNGSLLLNLIILTKSLLSLE